jgi:hypothetical protein
MLYKQSGEKVFIKPENISNMPDCPFEASSSMAECR